MDLTPEQRKKLREGIIKTYPDSEDLEILLSDNMDINFSEIAQGNKYETQVFNLLKYLEAQGKLEELLRAIAEDKPKSLFAKQIRQEFAYIFEDGETDKTDCQKLYRHLLKLGYERQVEEFVRLVQTQAIAAFVIHGSLKHGQRWLLNRLVDRYLPQNINPNTIIIDFGRAVSPTDIESLWQELGRKFSPKSNLQPTEIVPLIYHRWQTESILIVINDIHLMPEKYLEKFVTEFWHPLVRLTPQEGVSRNSNKLLMFLVDFQGSVEKLEGIFTEKVTNTQPEKPLRPLPLVNLQKNR
jgi:hypothetical protein